MADMQTVKTPGGLTDRVWSSLSEEVLRCIRPSPDPMLFAEAPLLPQPPLLPVDAVADHGHGADHDCQGEDRDCRDDQQRRRVRRVEPGPVHLYLLLTGCLVWPVRRSMPGHEVLVSHAADTGAVGLPTSLGVQIDEHLQ